MRNLLFLSIGMFWWGNAAAAEPVGTAFTYQGQIKEDGISIVDTCDFRYSLWDSQAPGGVQIGADINDTTQVDAGLFMAELDFGADTINGDARYLQIGVRCPAGAGAFATLSPRQAITPAPYALQTRGLHVDETQKKVGIGTNTPETTLHLESLGGVELTIEADTNNAGGEDQNARIVMSQDGGVVGARLGYRHAQNKLEIINEYNDSLILGTADSDHVTINSVGDVGIGQSAPQAKLHVEGAFDIANGGTETTTGGHMLVGQSSSFNLLYDGNEVQARAGNSPSTFFLNDRGGNVAIARSGNVGIGTPSPQAKLDVRSRIDVRRSDNSMLATVKATQDTGVMRLYGPNGQENVVLAAESRNLDYGFIGVKDAAGELQASMYVAGNVSGVIAADIKNFFMDNPSDPDTEIWYAAPEGPEAGCYIRGTARLVSGRCLIELPRHFVDVATEEDMTVHLTPRSAVSLGLAVTRSKITGIVVEELMHGSGSYEFDYMVSSVRKGFEDYQVIRPKSHMRDATGLSDVEE